MNNNDKTIRAPGADRDRVARAIAMRTADRASDVGHQPQGLIGSSTICQTRWRTLERGDRILEGIVAGPSRSSCRSFSAEFRRNALKMCSRGINDTP